ncbi:hypothetical protein ACTXT7_013467 [Hymenolepis weldensis]
MNRVANGPQPQKRGQSELDPPQTDSELPSIAGDSNSVRGGKQHCPPWQVPAAHKKQARLKKNTQKPEVAIPPKNPNRKQCQYPQQIVPSNFTTMPPSSNSLINRLRVSRISNSFVTFFKHQYQPYQRSRYYTIHLRLQKYCHGLFTLLPFSMQ